MGNSAACLWLDDKFLNAWRPGIALYGFNPVDSDQSLTKKLKPALEVWTKIVAVHNLKTGE